MVTVAVDLAYDSFPRALVDGEDATSICPPINGIKPDKLIIVKAVGPMTGTSGDLACRASFNDEKTARRWFAIVTDDPDPGWFDDNTVA
jgi:hypothetical protein